MDRDKFYVSVRPKLNLTMGNVVGMNKLLDYIEEKKLPTEHAAYALATAWWETGQMMIPVKEAYWLSEGWRARNLRYAPFYGRGLCQITWRENYAKAGQMLKLSDPLALVKNPDLALRWEYAIPLLFEGMRLGLYTGKKLGDYFDENNAETDREQRREYRAARRIINGTDKAAKIADLALLFERALEFSDHDWDRTKPIVMRNMPMLKMGDAGVYVRKLQQLLNAKFGARLAADGHFGRKTHDALIRFQTRRFVGLGVVNQATWTELLGYSKEV